MYKMFSSYNKSKANLQYSLLSLLQIDFYNALKYDKT